MVKAKFTKKKKNCDKGWGCGNSCISKNKGCRILAKEKSKKLLNMLATSPKAPADEVLNLLSKKSWTQKDMELFNSLGSKEKVSLGVSLTKAGKKDLLLAKKPLALELPKLDLLDVGIDSSGYKPTSVKSPIPELKGIYAGLEGQALIDKLNEEFPKGSFGYLTSKIDKNEGVDGLDRLESFAMSKWTSDSYADINGSIKGYKNTADGSLAANYLNKAIEKAPKFSPDVAKAELAKREWLDSEYNDGEYPLKRNLGLKPEEAKKFLGEMMVDAEANKKVTSNDTYEAYSYAEAVTQWPGNVSLNVKPAKTSKAALVDKYKNVMFEAEALYPTSTKFLLENIFVDGKRIKSIEELEESFEKGFNDAQVYMRELD